MSILEVLWRRASATTPVPDASAMVVIALAALASVIIAWPAVRMVVTVCHEAGHAIAATLTGRSLQGIRLHSDSSGVTLTRGKTSGSGMVLTLLAGYPAASLVGLFAAAVAGAGHAVALLWLLVGLLALMLLMIRNVHGALVVLVLGAASWPASSPSSRGRRWAWRPGTPPPTSLRGSASGWRGCCCWPAPDLSLS